MARAPWLAAAVWWDLKGPPRDSRGRGPDREDTSTSGSVPPVVTASGPTEPAVPDACGPSTDPGLEGTQEPVWAGGRDRDRTCDFCRVKTSPPAPSPRCCRFPHHNAAGRQPRPRWRARAARGQGQSKTACWAPLLSLAVPCHSASGTSHGFALIDALHELDDRCRRIRARDAGSWCAQPRLGSRLISLSGCALDFRT